jgi:hypothetical protein
MVSPNIRVALLASPAGPLTTGQPVNFTAYVTGGNLADRVGEIVTFLDGTTVLGTSPLYGFGQGVIMLPGLSAGIHVITAVYGGDDQYHGGVGSLVETVNLPTQTPTSATLTVPTRDPQPVGMPLTFTATVSGGSAEGRVGETVTFLDRNLVLGTGTLDASGRATFTTSSLAVGTHTVAAVYAGDTNSSGSSATLAVTVVTVPLVLSSTDLSASPASSTVGQQVMFTVTVRFGPLDPRGLTFTVTFRDGNTVLATLPLDGNFQAVYSTSSLSLGSHVITATYNGNVATQTSAGELHYQVRSAGTTMTTVALAADVPCPAPTGVPVTFTATLTGGTPAAHQGETVTFLDGSTVLGRGTLDANGRARFTTSTLVAGVHRINAVYDGDTDSLGSSAMLAYTVVLAG